MNRLSVLLVTAALLLPSSAMARGFAVRPHLEWQPVEAPTQSHGEDVDFDSLSIDEKRKIQKSLQVRRKMVDVHTVLAFAAAGLLVATEVVGIVNSNLLRRTGDWRANVRSVVLSLCVVVLSGVVLYVGFYTLCCGVSM